MSDDNDIRFELQAEADDGTWETWDYEYTKKAALNWFKETAAEYPESKFRVIRAKLKIIANCTIRPEIKCN